MTRRLPSRPTTDRLGVAAPMGVTRAWSSTRRVLRPCMAGSTLPPATPGRRSPRSRRPGSSTRLRPWSAISNSPSSPVGPKRCFTASRGRERVVAVPSKASTVSTRCSRARGPAREPSLVTWPTSRGHRRAGPGGQAGQAVGAGPHLGEGPRGPPTPWGSGTPYRDGVHHHQVGRQGVAHRLLHAGHVGVGRGDVEVGRQGAQPGGPGARTWGADSSADTSRAGWPAGVQAARRTWSSRVDLPTPGSPKHRVTDPGARPPASTRSTSPTPVGCGRPAVGGVHRVQGHRAWPRGRARPPPAPAGPRADSSTRVFHSPQVGHRPDPPGGGRHRSRCSGGASDGLGHGPMVGNGCDRWPAMVRRSGAGSRLRIVRLGTSARRRAGRRPATHHDPPPRLRRLRSGRPGPRNGRTPRHQVTGGSQ